MNSVTFPTTVGGDGSTITDDANGTTGLANGGHRARFVPALTNMVNIAEATVINAQTAFDSAQSALNYANTQATSVTSQAVATGSKTFTLAQSGKAFVVGTYVQIVATASPGNWLVGAVTAFSGTSLTVLVTGFGGSGTFTSWTVSLSCPPLAFLQVRTPVPSTPLNGNTNVSVVGPFTASAYGALYDEPRSVRRFQVTLAADTGFASPVVNQTVAADTLTLSASLSFTTGYLWRCRDEGTLGSVSDWSAVQSITTNSGDYIATPAATPSAGASFEGGFYAGLVWEQVTQSATSTALATGSKTFTVSTNMSVTPLFYVGQSIEVRSRATPSNKFIGTVTQAYQTTLVVNVSSIGGSGTFTDWSIMAKYRIIVAPRSTQTDTTTNSMFPAGNLPTASRTLTEGYASTVALAAAGSAGATYARALTTGGYTDWYVPARDELDVAYKSLKPNTESNYTTADRPVSAFGYGTNGSVADTSTSHGVNNNSSPTSSAHTTSVPPQTSVTAFQTGGAERFNVGEGTDATRYLTSSAYTDTQLWQQMFQIGPGLQTSEASNTGRTVRAVRRSII